MKNIPNNEIWYTTSDNSITNNFDAYAFGSQLLSNTYKDGIGKLKFSNDITVIGESAFALNEDIETIILPNSITKIDVGAFSACQGLQEIYIPNSVVEIGECAFGLCVNLMKFSGKFATKDGLCLIVNGVINQFALGNEMHEYSIPTEVSEIGWSSFSDSMLKKVILHENITKIGHSAFCGCENLEEINIPNSVTTIEDAAFQDCVNLKSCFIPKSVLNLGVNVFDGCNDISITYEDSSEEETENNDLESLLKKYAEIINAKSNEWKYSDDSSATFVRVPDGVEVITSDAFESCEDVETIYIPSSVKDIDAWAFCDLKNLSRFEGVYASEDGKCLIIKNTIVGFASKDIEEYQIPTGVKAIAANVFRYREELEGIIIPHGVTTIGDDAFFGCESLYNINLPTTLKYIGESAFADCSSLTEIVIPDSVRFIGKEIFRNSSIEKIHSPLLSTDGRCLIANGDLVHYMDLGPISEYTIPNNVNTITDWVFFNNSNIRKIVIPSSVAKIGANAFHSCSELSKVEFESAKPPQICYGAFSYNKGTFSIYVPEGCEMEYEKAFKKVGVEALVFTIGNNVDILDKIVNDKKFAKRISNEKLLSIGIDYYRKGDINASIMAFEMLITKGYKDDYPYNMLISIYKNQKDVENEIRILTCAIQNLPCRGNSHYEYQKRYDRLTSASKESTYPTKAPKVEVDKKHGDIFEELIINVPEFNFYSNGYEDGYGVIHAPSKAKIEDIWEIQRYFKKLIQDADLASTKKDYETAAKIYEQIILENYWMPTPCDKLIKLYAKSGLYDDEIRILKYGIEYFSQLRQKRLEYVKMLAKKYNAEKFLNERLASGGKITYYAGVFELYNPFPIIEKWEERLEKKLRQHINK